MIKRHTPGPWLSGLVNEADRSDSGCAHHVIAGEGKERQFIGEVALEADARLICAAPEMLAVLQTIAAGLVELEDDEEGDVRERVRALARAAIVKATGRD